MMAPMKTASQAIKYFQEHPFEATIHMDHRHIWDELDDIQEVASELRKAFPESKFCVWRRGRGNRKEHETYPGEFHSSLPLKFANYVSVYIRKD